MKLSSVTLLAASAYARDIVFPSLSGFHQEPMQANGAINVGAETLFAGLTTYANLPYVHCLAAEGEEVEKYDIAILGAPFDTVG